MTSRRRLDAYYTPDALAASIVSAVHAVEPIDGLVMEPHAGGGAFVRAILGQCPQASLYANDINPAAPGLHAAGWGDTGRTPYTTSMSSYIDRERLPLCQWVICNPPYSDAEAHTRCSLGHSRHVVSLLRLAFTESQKRTTFWAEHPARHVWVLAKRPSFTGGKTDSSAYGVFWWDREHQGPTTITPGWQWPKESRA